MIQPPSQPVPPPAEPASGRPSASGEEWLGRNRSEKRRLWERLNPRHRLLLRIFAEALALQQNHGRLPEPLRLRLSAALDDLDRLASRLSSLLRDLSKSPPK
jgi:hypothetical protein